MGRYGNSLRIAVCEPGKKNPGCSGCLRAWGPFFVVASSSSSKQQYLQSSMCVLCVALVCLHPVIYKLEQFQNQPPSSSVN